jgi:hypothetical protein
MAVYFSFFKEIYAQIALESMKRKPRKKDTPGK